MEIGIRLVVSIGVDMQFYRIRHKETGLFSSGGKYPKWNKRGKVWNSLVNLQAHLAIVTNSLRRWHHTTGQRIPDEASPYANAEIVEYNMVEGCVCPVL